MQTRLAVKLVVTLSLAALLGACSRSGDSKPAAAAGERTIGAIWSEMLTQRDQIHIAFLKQPEEVTHQDCADVGAAARRMDELYSELVNLVGAQSSTEDKGQLRAMGEMIARASGIVGKVRESALAEAPGSWPALRYPLDQSLREVETYFTVEALNSESVTKRPGFEATPPPEAPSAI